MSEVIVVGGGAAGMIAAIMAARNGHKVKLFEKNDKLGKKVFITGKGRCNITNANDESTFFDHILGNKKFLYSAFNQFNNLDTIDFFEEIGLRTKIERGNRVFPLSDKSSDVIDILQKEMRRLSVETKFNHTVEEIVVKDNEFYGVKIKNYEDTIRANAIIITTGGLSYPLTGSTGDGYRFAKNMGHKITSLYPSLVPIHTEETYVKDLMGLSLRNVNLTVRNEKKVIYEEFGEMLFTHFGLSGPTILTISSLIVPHLRKNEKLTISIDLKPALTFDELDKRVIRDFEEYNNKQFKNSLDKLLPKKLIDIIIKLSKIDPEKKVCEIRKAERHELVNLLKGMEFTVDKLSGYNQAVVTKGGVNLREINPKTMESKLIKKIYFAGELLDLDAMTGGYNLQIAWSTGYLAGLSVLASEY